MNSPTKPRLPGWYVVPLVAAAVLMIGIFTDRNNQEWVDGIQNASILCIVCYLALLTANIMSRQNRDE